MTKEIILYIFWGCVSMAANWSVYAIFVEFINLSPETSNIIAWFVAVVVAYITNKFFVFKQKGNIIREILMFFSARIFSGIIEMLCLPIMLNILNWGCFFGVYGLGEKIILSTLVILLNYLFSKLFIFKNIIKKGE